MFFTFTRTSSTDVLIIEADSQEAAVTVLEAAAGAPETWDAPAEGTENPTRDGTVVAEPEGGEYYSAGLGAHALVLFTDGRNVSY